MKIQRIDDGRFEVQSDSGATYHITYAGSGDGDPEYIALWECSCPAGQHGRDCKHLKHFLESRLTETEDGADGDAVEITGGQYHWLPAD